LDIAYLQDCLTCFEQTLPGVGGNHWGASPVQQLNVELRSKLRDAGRYGGLRNSRAVCTFCPAKNLFIDTHADIECADRERADNHGSPVEKWRLGDGRASPVRAVPVTKLMSFASFSELPLAGRRYGKLPYAPWVRVVRESYARREQWANRLIRFTYR
jgi:hypothetical protein